MKILHLAAHLGGGIGKAHAAMAPHLAAAGVEQTFTLLEEPIDRRHVEAIERHGGTVAVISSPWEARRLAQDADVLQFEFWGHPALDRFLDGWGRLYGLPTVTWCHVSGLHPPLIPERLISGVDRFVATSGITAPGHPVEVVNSGFGFKSPRANASSGGLVYLGTVDFKKLHPEFFSAVDRAGKWLWPEPMAVWGHVSPEAKAAASALRHPERIRLRGHTPDPRAALSGAGIFFYPLGRAHYGTAENALVEAMSLGLVPIVLDNPAEMAIVSDGETGIVVSSIEEAVMAAQRLAGDRCLRGKLARNAREEARMRSPQASAKQFVGIWRSLAQMSRLRMSVGTGIMTRAEVRSELGLLNA